METCRNHRESKIIALHLEIKTREVDLDDTTGK